MGLLSTIEQSLGFDFSSSTSKSSNNAAEETNTSESSFFSSLLNFGSSEDGQSTLPDLTSAESESLTSQLFSSLGLGGSDDAFSADVLSEDAFSVKQLGFLSSLQSNFLSGLGSSSSVETTDLSVDSVDSTDMFSSIYKFGFGEDGASLDDAFDTVNILHHIPIISDIYESTTGDNAFAASSLMGSYLYAGPAGVAYSIADMVVEKFTGESITGNIYDFASSFWSSLSGAPTTSEEIQSRNAT